MVSSSVRSRLIGLRLIGTDRSVIAPPFQRSSSVGVCVGVVAVHGDVDLVEQAAQQLFAVLVGGGGRRPHAGEVVTERQDR